jgi:D-beta-D-heptose 7-phosphate kinase/D-beta-D-heptose 1-phosphate adenosyltransferase
MLDQFIWGSVGRISPEAPVPVVDFEQESFMPGGAANVARNLTALDVPTDLFGVVGDDHAASQLRSLLASCAIGCRGVINVGARCTSMKTRIVAHRQQVVRIDRESRSDIDPKATSRLLQKIKKAGNVGAIVLGDYAKGVITQELLDSLRAHCRQNGIWLSMDPKPAHTLNLSGLSLITPNRKETFELARLSDDSRHADPLSDTGLLCAAEKLLQELNPAILLVTLGEQGMLLCQRGLSPVHIPTVAKEVFDVSGAGDTVIATFTLAVTGGASPLEAAILANHAAGVVVGKLGTATVTRDELLASLS